MSRRRKKNPLLMRIIVVSVAAHAIALPIAAHFGAFEKLKRQFGPATVVMITTPPLEEKRPEKKEEKKAPKKAAAAAKKGANTAKRSNEPSKPNPNETKVITGGQGNGEGNGPTADANATGKAGVVPTGPGTTQPATNTNTTAPPVNKAPTDTEKTTTPPPPPPPPPPLPVAPKEKKFVQVETTYAPEPTIPDDLRAEPFEKTLLVEADISTSGAPKNVKVVDSTGNRELDDIGLNTAKQYKFKPATLDDQPTEGHVRFRIIFKVE